MAKYRVYEIAKELGINSKELLELLPDMGIAVKSHMTALTDEEVNRIIDELAPDDDEKAKESKPMKSEIKDKSGKQNDNKNQGKTQPEKPKKTDKKKKKQEEIIEEEDNSIKITVPITVKGYSEQIDKLPNEVIMKLMGLGIMANINQDIDKDTVLLLSEEFGVNVSIAGEVEDNDLEALLEDFEDAPEDLEFRPPVITVMGHVDHGKTSLLDTMRKTNVTAKESGGITQHIGASEVYVGDKKIVFLDTPGHEAFTAMRARGASITDIAILVVAADDGVKPQTIEAISHAKAADIPIIVAINKMDKPTSNPMKVKQELSENGILVEEWGGDVISVPVSATTGEGIDQLLEMILLMAEMLELKANPNRLAIGTVVEAKLDTAKGSVATIIIQNGTLEVGMSIVAGASYGRVRAMINSKGKHVKKVGPSSAVEILGLSSVPEAGDVVHAVR
ncbi:MAG: translation initiation factor IF-2, partial [Clostridia bacterium]|nr:translation initiation factor IF-2 [Clostridia bacterium]